MYLYDLLLRLVLYVCEWAFVHLSPSLYFVAFDLLLVAGWIVWVWAESLSSQNFIKNQRIDNI